MFSKCMRSGLTSLFLMFCVAPSALAQPPANLATVLDLTLRHHPVLARIDAERRLLDPALVLASQTPPLNVGLESENFGDDGTGRLETTLSLAGVLEWSGQPSARGAVALSENEAKQLELAQQRREVLAEAAKRFIDLAGAQQALVQARDAEALAKQTLNATQRRSQAGAASKADEQRAGLILGRAQMTLAQAELTVQTARQTLLLATGAPQWPLMTVEATLDRLPTLPDSESLLALASESPAVRLADARLSIARNQLELARRQSRPDLNWTLGVRHDAERDDQSLLLGFSLPLGQSRRSQPLRDSAQAGVDRADEQTRIASLELQALLLDTWQALAKWKHEAKTLNAQLIPQGEAMVASLRTGYAQGRYSLLELTSAETELNALRGQLLSARIRYHQSWIALERLLGRPLIAQTPQEQNS